MDKTIKTTDLKIKDVPDKNANWNEISKFALSFNPKEELGTEEIYSHSRMSFDRNSSLQELRTSLFLLQRWWNNRSEIIDQKTLETIRDLLKLIRAKL